MRISDLSSDVCSSDLKEEVNRVIGTAIKSFGTYANTSRGPSELLPTIKLFADPSFGKYIKTNHPKVSPDDLTKATEEFNHYYASAAIPIVRKEYVNSIYATGDRKSTRLNSSH